MTELEPAARQVPETKPRSVGVIFDHRENDLDRSEVENRPLAAGLSALWYLGYHTLFWLDLYLWTWRML